MQPPTVLVTSRQVRNSHTGLDLSVPQHQEVRGDMMSGHVEYQVLVVTRLAAFKSAKHRPEDVVQFLVSKKYSEIEDLYQRLSSRYPGASLPALPRKVLFVGEADIRERRAAFHDILGCVARDAQLAASPELLEFLGTRAPGAVDPGARDGPELDADGQAGEDAEALDFFQQQDPGDEEEPPGSSRAGKAQQQEEEEEEEEEVLDPLGIMRTKKPKKPREPAPQPQPKPLPRLTIFDEEEDPEEELFGPGGERAPQRRPPEKARGLDPLKLFEDPDLGGAVPLGDPLLLPAARETGGFASRLGPRETSEELFRVEEDLDQILKLGAEPPPRPRPPVAPKPVLPSKPAIPPKPGRRATTEPEPRPPLQQQAQAMDEMDILRYIREQEAPGQAAPSLF
ncbi:HCLS1-binding protein 3 [Sorex araneus]|uniref:HCLS1-binding protein 3 n=1 Tax=Sorex araneus TaxID=42254 RepID=UPI002433FD58|nr:HCLS1-binding protein 3 [Sorex araneus]